MKRIFSFGCIMAVMFGILILRLAYIANGEIYVEAAVNQSRKVFLLAETRAGIFDRNLKPFVNINSQRRTLVFSDIMDVATVKSFVDDEEFSKIIKSPEPTVIDLGGKIIEGEGIYNFSFPERYGRENLAPHVIGYTSSGKGVCGIEQSFDEFLDENGKTVSAAYYTDGMGRLLVGEEIELIEEETFENAGVVLTLDRDIQRVTEKALEESLEKGAAVVMDAETGEILACASVPEFEPDSVADFLDADGSPFINRAFAAYSAGSTWKIVVAAAALDMGLEQNRTYTCTGSTEVDGIVYKCHWENGHGEINMERALEISCNPYFIDLALEVGGERILETAKNLGFGTAAVFGENYSSAAGKLPSEDSLSAKTVLASFAFGQGKLMVTLVQMAALASAVANGGRAVTPKLVLGSYDRNGEYSATAEYPPNPAMKTETAEKLAKMMVGVVEKGSGENAKPKEGSAGGKTASAQTGQYDAEGNEVIHAWFVGFYPAENPEYAVAVFAEGMNSGGEFAAPVFKKICDGIFDLSD